LRTTTAQVANAVGSARLVAFTETYHPAGGVAGATYSPVLVIDPTVEFPPVTPLTDHVAAVLVAPLTFAVICFELPTGTVTFRGSTVTVTPAPGYANVGGEQNKSMATVIEQNEMAAVDAR